MTPPVLAAEFLDTATGRLFVTWRAPEADRRAGAVLVAPPLAEEMNKSRAILRDLGIALAEKGWVLIIPDLYGTGDSSGDFGDARLDTWADNLEAVASHFEDAGYPLRMCLAVRGGSLIAGRWLVETGRSLETLILWQPQIDGSQVVNQWLRLRAAASLFDGSERVSQKGLRESLVQGSVVTFSGYRLTPALTRDLEAARLDTCAAKADHIELIEIGKQLSPVAARLAENDARVHASCLNGEPFWSATEVVRNPPLVESTVRSVIGMNP